MIIPTFGILKLKLAFKISVLIWLQGASNLAVSYCVSLYMHTFINSWMHGFAWQVESTKIEM